MSAIALEVLFILLLVMANGVFALSEMAVVSARKARLQQRAQEGDPGAQVALELANAPGRFLSTIQIGITLVGVLAGALGGATIARALATWLNRLHIIAPYSEAISIGLVVLAITYLSLVIGELVPKRLALSNPERVASAIAPPMRTLSRIVAPLTHILGLSTEAVLRVLGMRASAEPPVTEEEIKLMIEQGTRVGIFEPSEQEMIKRVFRLGDRRVSALMTPRPEIVWLDADDPLEKTRRRIAASHHSCFPVAHDDLDNVLGLALAKDLLSQCLSGQPIDLTTALCPALFVPEGMPAFGVLERFKETRSHIALVIDEYGGVQGLVTANDVLEAIVGDIPLTDEEAEPEIVQREDGSWLADGMLLIDELKEFLEIEELPDEEEYQTLGGLVMMFLGRVPSAGDHFELVGLRFEVVDMDGHRVDKVLIAPAETTPR